MSAEQIVAAYVAQDIYFAIAGFTCLVVGLAIMAYRERRNGRHP